MPTQPLPYQYWETHWEVTAWNTNEDEPYVNFFASRDEADAKAAKLVSQGYNDVEVTDPPLRFSTLFNPEK